MRETIAGQAANTTAEKLPRRDWILLPLLSFFTVLVLAVALDFIGDRMLPSVAVNGRCIEQDPVTGPRGVPNAVCSFKAAEGPLVDYSFNRCGHRAGMECGPKAPGTYRIALAGGSYVFGWSVARERTFAALLPLDLSRRTGRKVEVYNTSMFGEGGVPRTVALRFNEVLAAQPDAILWVVSPFDIDKGPPEGAPWFGPGIVDAIKYHVRQALNRKAPLEAIPAIWATARDKWVASKAGLLIKHLLYQSQSRYVQYYLEKGVQIGFLKTAPDPSWKSRMEEFDGYAADVLGRAKTAGVPVIFTLVPNRGQAAMISMGQWPAGYDPYKLGEDLRAIVVNHGGTYIDILPEFRAVPNPEQYYYPVNNHPDAAGNAILSEMLAKALTNGSVPSLKVAQPQVAWKLEN